MTDFRRNCDARLAAAEAALAGRPRLGPVVENQAYASNANLELAQGLRTCMKEIVELRAELSAEKETKNQLMVLYSKRLREEMRVEMGAKDQQTERALRELRCEFQQRLTEADSVRESEKRRWEEAIRHVKVHERQQFDVAEEFREAMDEVRGRLDAAVNLCHAAKSEMARDVERERTTIQHRLDVELMRYGELHRQHQQQLEVAKSQLSREVCEVSKTVRNMVDDVWAEKIKNTTRSIEDTVAIAKEKQEQFAAQLSEIQTIVSENNRKMNKELQLITTSLRERVSQTENTLPLLSSRVDRYEKRGEALAESNSRLCSQVDLMREIADKAVAQASRAMERSQKMEDTSTERDHRITALEAQTVALAGVDKWRSELEATKRGVARVEHAIDGIKQIADADERRVESMQQRLDASIERVETTEKKTTSALSKLAASDKKVVSFIDRVVSLEDNFQRSQASLEQLESTTSAASSKIDSVEVRLSHHAEKIETVARDQRDMSSRFVSDADELREVARVTEGHNAATKRELEKLSSRLVKNETVATNLQENLKDCRELVDAHDGDLNLLKKRVDGSKQAFDRQLAEFDTRIASIGDARLIHQVEQHTTRVEKRLDQELDHFKQVTSENLRAIENRVARSQETPRYAAPDERSTGIQADAFERLQSQVTADRGKLAHVERLMDHQRDEMEERLSKVEQETARNSRTCGALQAEVKDIVQTAVPDLRADMAALRTAVEKDRKSPAPRKEDDNQKPTEAEVSPFSSFKLVDSSPNKSATQPDQVYLSKLPPPAPTPSASIPPPTSWRPEANPFGGATSDSAVSLGEPEDKRPPAKTVRATGYISSDSSSPELMLRAKTISKNPFHDSPEGSSEVETRKPAVKVFASESEGDAPESAAPKSFHTAARATRSSQFDDTSSDEAKERQASTRTSKSSSKQASAKAASNKTAATDLSEMDLTLSPQTASKAEGEGGSSEKRAASKPVAREMFAHNFDDDESGEDDGAAPLDDDELLRFGKA